MAKSAVGSAAGKPQRVVFTDRWLNAKRPLPPAGRRIDWDALVPHFGLRTTAKGARSWIVVLRRPGQRDPDTVVLGKYPALGLADARERARDTIKLLQAGKSPAAMKAESARLEAQKKQETFAAAVDAYVEAAKVRGSYMPSVESILRREFLGQLPQHTVSKRIVGWVNGPHPVWRNRPIADIARRDVVEMLEGIITRGAHRSKGKRRTGGIHAARHALNAIRKLDSWIVEGERYGITTSFVANITESRTLGVDPDKHMIRTRVLDDAELRDVWQWADQYPYPFGPLIKLLMLTGQRENDWAGASRDELMRDGEAPSMLVIPKERYKGRRPHEVPLGPTARQIVQDLPHWGGPYLFSSRYGTKPIVSYSNMKTGLDRWIAAKRAKEGRAPMPAWVLHDLRRTVRTRLSELQVDRYTAERIIGHALPGLDPVYDQSTHRTQKLNALTLWDTTLMQIVDPKPTAPNVVGVEVLAQHRRRKSA